MTDSQTWKSFRSPVQLSVNLAPDAQEAIEYLMRQESKSVVEVITICLARTQFFAKEVEKGNTILIRDKKGNIQEVIFNE